MLTRLDITCILTHLVEEKLIMLFRISSTLVIEAFGPENRKIMAIKIFVETSPSGATGRTGKSIFQDIRFTPIDGVQDEPCGAGCLARSPKFSEDLAQLASTHAGIPTRRTVPA
jgi:hypothetical protein